MFYQICRRIAQIFLRLFFRYEVIGVEHIPKEGPVLICPNHIHVLDPPLVGATVNREMAFMAKEELFKIPVLSLIIRHLNSFPVKRGGTDKRVIRTSLDILKQGQAFLIFPEGTRSKTGELGKGLRGAGFIALRVPCTVTPVAIIGPYRLFRKVKVVFGSPVQLDDLRQDRISKEQAQEATDRIMGSIQFLLDEHEAHRSH